MLGSLCQQHRIPFDARLFLQLHPPAGDGRFALTDLLRAAKALKLDVDQSVWATSATSIPALPALAFVRPETETAADTAASDEPGDHGRSRPCFGDRIQFGARRLYEVRQPVNVDLRRGCRRHSLWTSCLLFQTHASADGGSGRRRRQPGKAVWLFMVHPGVASVPRHLAGHPVRILGAADCRPGYASVHAGRDRQSKVTALWRIRLPYQRGMRSCQDALDPIDPRTTR